MSWIKRNLIWLIGLLAFVLVALGSLLLLKNQVAERDKVAIELETQIKELERLTSRANFPDPGNVKDMQHDNEQMEQKISQLLKQFARDRVPTQSLTGIKFREIMNKRTQDLGKLARRQSVSIPLDYLFGFGRYEKTIPENAHVPLLIKQLNVIEEIATTLLKSPRVLLLDSIGRVEFEEAGGAEEARARRKADEVVDMPNNYKGIQNDPAETFTVMPFQLQFAADPEGLRNFLNNLTRSKYLLIPSYITVKCDETDVTGKVKKAEVTPEGKVITPLPEEAQIAAETTKYVLGQQKINILMRINWVEFREDESKQKREPRRDKKEGEPTLPQGGASRPAGAVPPAAGGNPS